jgi:hypothetical protein
MLKILLNSILTLLCSCGDFNIGTSSSSSPSNDPKIKTELDRVTTLPMHQRIQEWAYGEFVKKNNILMDRKLALEDLPTVIFLDAEPEKDSQDTEIIGNCDPASNKIYLTSFEKARISPTKYEIMVFHELGHCVLGREDTYDEVLKNLPLSIMHWNMDGFSDNFYQLNRERYLEELFIDHFSVLVLP